MVSYFKCISVDYEPLKSQNALPFLTSADIKDGAMAGEMTQHLRLYSALAEI